MSEQVKINIIEADGNKHYYWALKGKNIREIMEIIGIETPGTCGGRGICGKCKVRIDGELSEISDFERENLLADEIKAGLRLGCYCYVRGEVSIYIDDLPDFSDIKNSLINTKNNLSFDRQLANKRIFIPGLQRESPVPIYDRLRKALPDYKLDLTIENLAELCKIDRLGRPTLELNTLIIDEQRAIYVGRQKKTLYAVAIDIGSTSLFAALLDMASGEIVAVNSQTNMQRVYGDDIISRIKYCLEREDGNENLHYLLINNLNTMIVNMLEEVQADATSIYKIAVVGNPVMLHFFVGLTTSGFAAVPYTGIFSDEMEYPAIKTGLNVNNDAEVYILPQLGGFVGADTTACLLSIDNIQEETYLMLDIGTNGEVVLYHKGDIWAASAAAGPAFEGGVIKNGMRAGNGAIDRASIQNTRLNLHIIGDELPRGICGSGIIDLIAALYKEDYLDNNGSFKSRVYDDFFVRKTDKGTELVLFDGESTYNGFPLVLTQDDIRQVQLAKGAIRTAVDILLQKADLEYNDIERIYFAGAFGNYINPENSILIGMIPEVDLNRITNIGNAAAEGAIMALRSSEKRDRARSIKEQVEYVELAVYKEFQDLFLKNINFPAVNRS